MSAVISLANHQLINSSKSNEWFTPPLYIEAAREVLGEIDLDPASCEAANRIVKARRYLTIADDGLAHPWAGRVFLNPPYGKTGGQSNQGRWAHCLIKQYQSGVTREAILLMNS